MSNRLTAPRPIPRPDLADLLTPLAARRSTLVALRSWVRDRLTADQTEHLTARLRRDVGLAEATVAVPRHRAGAGA